MDGRVHALHIVVGHPLLAAASYNAVRLWEFKPYVLDGKTLPMDTRLTVNFTLIVAEGLPKSTSPFLAYLLSSSFHQDGDQQIDIFGKAS